MKRIKSGRFDATQYVCLRIGFFSIRFLQLIKILADIRLDVVQELFVVAALILSSLHCQLVVNLLNSTFSGKGEIWQKMLKLGRFILVFIKVILLAIISIALVAKTVLVVIVIILLLRVSGSIGDVNVRRTTLNLVVILSGVATCR